MLGVTWPACDRRPSRQFQVSSSSTFLPVSSHLFLNPAAIYLNPDRSRSRIASSKICRSHHQPHVESGRDHACHATDIQVEWTDQDTRLNGAKGLLIRRRHNIRNGVMDNRQTKESVADYGVSSSMNVVLHTLVPSSRYPDEDSKMTALDEGKQSSQESRFLALFLLIPC
ncbi:hypothetical protein P170DRAFT_3039 [Aspergillus steynii IBT 23096]|uniref:Uncharacterized protein n=1 Tax=Aspergillus steynii IBT 23096 TaxID=1392250 RepID=A0A2I2GLG0_9EURO|nr:uncharacterized protein P170DRAFT_3039 [Aspergillus steynii IBT 23096]PLB53714.1 hypothetical protein P170DRAFT_3039 [Aspergillus steynii IBT 23096]